MAIVECVLSSGYDQDEVFGISVMAEESGQEEGGQGCCGKGEDEQPSHVCGAMVRRQQEIAQLDQEEEDPEE